MGCACYSQVPENEKKKNLDTDLQSRTTHFTLIFQSKHMLLVKSPDEASMPYNAQVQIAGSDIYGTIHVN